jgi:hypothetical protein
LNNSSGAMVGEVLVLYVTVLVLAVCVCVVLAIEKRGKRDDRYYRPTYLRILLLSLLSYLLPLVSTCSLLHLPIALRELYSLSDPALVKERKANQREHISG